MTDAITSTAADWSTWSKATLATHSPVQSDSVCDFLHACNTCSHTTGCRIESLVHSVQTDTSLQRLNSNIESKS